MNELLTTAGANKAHALDGRIAPVAHFRDHWPAASDEHRSAMKTIICSFLICLLMVGCGSRHLEVVGANDPGLPAKLGITDQNWVEIRQLATQKKGFVVHGAVRLAPGAIEVWFKKPEDVGGTQGGPTLRYEKNQGRWVTGIEGDWFTAQATNQ